MYLSTPYSIQMFGDKTTVVARTAKAFFRTCKVTNLHENLFQSMVLHQIFLQLWDTLKQVQAMETGNWLTQKPSHLSCLDGGERHLFSDLSKHRNL